MRRMLELTLSQSPSESRRDSGAVMRPILELTLFQPPSESDTGGDSGAVMRRMLELTLCQPTLNLIRLSTGGFNNTAMRHILELTLRQPPLNLTQEATAVRKKETVQAVRLRQRWVRPLRKARIVRSEQKKKRTNRRS
jgi:hypothetical protein